MTDRNLPQLELPTATTLHAPTYRKPHIDSEEAVQYERRRVSRELEPIYPNESSRQSSEAPQTGPSHASLRSRNTSLQDSAASRERLRRHSSATSGASTQLDVPGASQDGARSSRTSTRVPHWQNPITRFWNTHISITIEEGAHRDHLGIFAALSELLTAKQI
jgi:hypothetical protein